MGAHFTFTFRNQVERRAWGALGGGLAKRGISLLHITVLLLKLPALKS